MYRRFLNNSDYLGIITQEALQQLTRGNDDRFFQAEQSAEMSIVEYLSENYEVETELAKGKYIADYDRRITYPVGVHIYHEGQIHEVIRSINGYRKPAIVAYWEDNRYQYRCLADSSVLAIQYLLSGRQGKLQRRGTTLKSIWCVWRSTNSQNSLLRTM